ILRPLPERMNSINASRRWRKRLATKFKSCIRWSNGIPIPALVSRTQLRVLWRRSRRYSRLSRGSSWHTKEGNTMTALATGTIAPDFTLHSTPDQRLSLAELRGRPVVLVFYPADWSPVCGDQLALYNELRQEFAKSNAVLLGLSVDGAWCHAAYAKDRHLHFSLLADFEPKGEVARRFGVYRDKDGF